MAYESKGVETAKIEAMPRSSNMNGPNMRRFALEDGDAELSDSRAKRPRTNEATSVYNETLVQSRNPEHEKPEGHETLYLAAVSAASRKPATEAPGQNDDEDSALAHMGLLGRLPAELRNEIYEFALISVNDIYTIDSALGQCTQGFCIHSKLSLSVPALLNTCHQIRYEGMPVFCGGNAFRFEAQAIRSGCMRAFLRSLGPSAKLIKTVALGGYYGTRSLTDLGPGVVDPRPVLQLDRIPVKSGSVEGKSVFAAGMDDWIISVEPESTAAEKVEGKINMATRGDNRHLVVRCADNKPRNAERSMISVNCSRFIRPRGDHLCAALLKHIDAVFHEKAAKHTWDELLVDLAVSDGFAKLVRHLEHYGWIVWTAWETCNETTDCFHCTRFDATLR